MPELPSHPDERRDASGLEPTRSKRRWVSAVWIAVVVVGVAIVVLHLAGVMGPGSH